MKHSPNENKSGPYLWIVINSAIWAAIVSWPGIPLAAKLPLMIAGGIAIGIVAAMMHK
jgi:hypothetical protein